jgi:hypothetical protein
MANRRNTPQQPKSFAANAAIFVAAAFFALPALAATTCQVPCSDTKLANLDVAVTALLPKAVSHEVMITPVDDGAAAQQTAIEASASLLAPRAEAAIRKAFTESDSAADTAAGMEPSKTVVRPPMAGTDSLLESTVDDDNGTRPASGMKTRVPGVSDENLSRYKKQMFRRDI